ncbi:uncharacterized protein LOC126373208 [Pectinophora gossypiella]|uniref:uncharacterized protein LOC126373208 n=1 Tax=Pectinophora gossypiella TaxID=13191 RepID=UPI00214E5C0B|nr:uncharacterized protein LOC126373208 [Pectinophora gossypiella]
MRFEVPEFKKCCCCVPLRYGLLAWGYLKLLIGLSLLLVVLIAAFNMRHNIPELIAFWVFVIFVCLLDISFNIVFIVGAHTKNYKLLRVFYYATIVGVVAYFLLFLVYFLIQLIALTQADTAAELHNYRITVLLVEEIAEVCVNIALDCYLLLLTRSEILKLQRSCRFQFTNNAADAEIQYNLHTDIPDLDVQGMTPDNLVITKTDAAII